MKEKRFCKKCGAGLAMRISEERCPKCKRRKKYEDN